MKVLPVTPDRWHDVEEIFSARGCSQARGCWCMHYRQRGTVVGTASRAVLYRAALKALVDAGRSPGLIGYRDRQPVGWVSLAPREEFARLARSPVMKPVDDQPVWSIICFVVPPVHRGQGVARALLHGAIDYAREHGARLLEAYPVDKPGRSNDANMWFGPKALYDRAGFTEVARRKATRPVVRLSLE